MNDKPVHKKLKALKKIGVPTGKGPLANLSPPAKASLTPPKLKSFDDDEDDWEVKPYDKDDRQSPAPKPKRRIPLKKAVRAAARLKQIAVPDISRRTVNSMATPAFEHHAPALSPQKKPTPRLKKSDEEIQKSIGFAYQTLHAGGTAQVRIAEVMALTKLSKPTIYRKMGKGEFPKCRKDGHLSWWMLAEIEAHLQARSAGVKEYPKIKRSGK